MNKIIPIQQYTDPTEVEVVEAPAVRKRRASSAFAVARLECGAILTKLLINAELSPLQQAQARAIVGLCGLRLHSIHGEAEADDFLALRDDLEAIAKHVDPLILAVGIEAMGGSREIEIELFTTQLFGALDGNATANLDEAAEYVERERDE